MSYFNGRTLPIARPTNYKLFTVFECVCFISVHAYWIPVCIQWTLVDCWKYACIVSDCWYIALFVNL